MNWYVAKMIYRIVCGDGRHQAQFDEQLRLIKANDSEEAFRKAGKMGLNEQDSFYNQQEQLVRWQFITVSELYPLVDFIDGAEICSRIKEVENAEAYINFVQQRSAYIQQEKAIFPINLI